MDLDEKELEITEFDIFVIGPFPTNFYLDLNQFEALPDEQVEILQSILEGPKKLGQIQKIHENKNWIDSLGESIDDLRRKDLVSGKEKFLKLQYFITEKGKAKLLLEHSNKKYFDDFINDLNTIFTKEKNTEIKYCVKDGRRYYNDLFENDILRLKEPAFPLVIVESTYPDCISFDKVEKNPIEEMIFEKTSSFCSPQAWAYSQARSR